MSTADSRLLFERPIADFDKRIARLGTSDNASPEVRDEMRALRRERNALVRKVYSNLEPWETVQVARHPERPKTCDYIDLVFDEFVELHGDRFFGDDRAIWTGFAKLATFKVLVVGHQKGKTTTRSASPATSAARIPKATARRWPRCGWPASSAAVIASSTRRAPTPASAPRSAARPGDRREHPRDVAAADPISAS